MQMTDAERRQVESLSITLAKQVCPGAGEEQLVPYLMNRLSTTEDLDQLLQTRAGAVRNLGEMVLPIVPFFVFLAYHFVKQKVDLHLLKEKIGLAKLIKNELGLEGKEAMQIVEQITSADLDIAKLRNCIETAEE